MFTRRINRLHQRFIASRLSPVSQQVRKARLTYLSPQKLWNLENCLRRIRQTPILGTVVEAGVALGGSSIVLASQMGGGRNFIGFDVFGMIPPPGPMDDKKSHQRYATIADGASRGIGDDRYYGYEDDLYSKVVQRFVDFGLTVDGARIELRRGLFADTMEFSADQRIALAHIDCDWYEPVALCLDRILPRLSSGGFIVLDDYHDYGGCRRAADELLERCSDGLEVVSRRGNLVLKKR